MRLTADFSTKIMANRGQWNYIFKVMKETVNLEFHMQQKYASKIKTKYFRTGKNRNTKGSSSCKKKIIPKGNTDLHEGMKINDKYR